MVRILLTGHAGSVNRGCEAIVRCTVDLIRRHIGPAEIRIMSFNPASDRAALIPGLGNVQVPDVPSSTPQKYSFRWLAAELDRRVLQRLSPGLPSYFSLVNRSLYRDSDVVISVGGDNFWDGYGVPSHFFGELSLARSLGALTVIWGGSISPFRVHNKRFEGKWGRELRKVHLITVRDPISLDYLKGLGVVENVRLVADPAFLLKADSKGAIQLDVCESGRIVGIGMSGLVSEYGLRPEKYLGAFAALAEAILSDTENKLVLMPHVFGKGARHDDKAVCERLAERLDGRDRVTVLGSNHNACQIKHVIGQCDYFVGARTHSTIAGLSSGVPTLSIAYSTKAYGINKLIFGHTDYVLPIAGLDEASLMSKFALLRENRPEIVKQLARRLPVVESMANRGGEYLADVLRRHKMWRAIV